MQNLDEQKFRDSEHLVNLKFHVLTISSFPLSNKQTKNGMKKYKKKCLFSFPYFRHSMNSFPFRWKVDANLTTWHTIHADFLPKNICICSAFVGAHSVLSLPFSHIKLELKCFFSIVYFFFGCLLGLITLFKHLIIPKFMRFFSFLDPSALFYPISIFFAHFKYCSRSICIHCMYIFFVERFTICLYNELILWETKEKDQQKMNKLQVCSTNALADGCFWIILVFDLSWMKILYKHTKLKINKIVCSMKRIIKKRWKA